MEEERKPTFEAKLISIIFDPVKEEFFDVHVQFKIETRNPKTGFHSVFYENVSVTVPRKKTMLFYNETRNGTEVRYKILQMIFCKLGDILVSQYKADTSEVFVSILESSLEKLIGEWLFPRRLDFLRIVPFTSEDVTLIFENDIVIEKFEIYKISGDESDFAVQVRICDYISKNHYKLSFSIRVSDAMLELIKSGNKIAIKKHIQELFRKIYKQLSYGKSNCANVIFSDIEFIKFFQLEEQVSSKAKYNLDEIIKNDGLFWLDESWKSGWEKVGEEDARDATLEGSELLLDEENFGIYRGGLTWEEFVKLINKIDEEYKREISQFSVEVFDPIIEAHFPISEIKLSKLITANQDATTYNHAKKIVVELTSKEKYGDELCPE